MNDTLLPRTVVTRTDYLLEIVNDTIALASNGQWADVTVYRETNAGAVGFFGDVIGGTFDVSGGVATFHSTGGDNFTGALSGGTLTITIGAKAVYRK